MLLMLGISYYFFSNAFRLNDVNGVEMNLALRFPLFLFVLTDIICFFIQIKAKLKTMIIVVFSMVTIYASYQGIQYIYRIHMICKFAEPFIQANVPDKADFNNILERDLKQYFQSKNANVTNVKYQFLSEGLLPSGNPFPHYYLWVKIYRQNIFVNQGFIAVFPVQKKKFEVFTYISKDEIKRAKKDIYKFFPKPICKKLEEKAKEK